jgi:hypothetical protein
MRLKQSGFSDFGSVLIRALSKWPLHAPFNFHLTGSKMAEGPFWDPIFNGARRSEHFLTTPAGAN